MDCSGANADQAAETSMTPLISVIIPCYNLGAYVDEAIQSVLAQTVQDFEILVLDDGSSDPHTVQLLANASWPHTTTFRTANSGVARARNFLIQRSRGDFLCALDADDKLHPQYFERTLAAFEASPDLTFVASRLQMFGEQNLITPASLQCDLPTLLTDCPLFSAALVVRSAVIAIGGYDEQMPAQGDEDWDLWISLLEAGHRGIILPDILFYYRRRAGSLCDTCTTGETHLRLVEYLTRKHDASFRAHLEEALLWKDRQHQERWRSNWQIQQEIDGQLVSIARRRAELSALQATLVRERELRSITESQPLSNPSSDGEVSALRAEYGRAIRELEALRASRSWKVTAPLRAAYRLLQAFRGRTT